MYKRFQYGAGHYAELFIVYAKAHNLIIKGLIVSDGEKHFEKKDDYPVFDFSENIDCSKDCSIISALGRQYWNEVITVLKERGIRVMMYGAII